MCILFQMYQLINILLGEFNENGGGSSTKVCGRLDTFEDHRDWELSSTDLLK